MSGANQTDTTALAETLIDALRKKGLTLAFAESCTGGLAAAAVVAVPGASDVFFGGIVSYDNSVKENLLGVPRSVLESAGAVSAPCALQMARGAREAVGADIAVSVTGIAGPGGGTPEKPVGTVYIAVSSSRGARARRLYLGKLGGRNEIRARSVFEMLALALGEAEEADYSASITEF